MTRKELSPRNTLMGKIERLLILISFIILFFAIFPFFSEKVFLLTHPSYQAVDMKILGCDVDVLVSSKYKHHETACRYQYHWDGKIYRGVCDSVHQSMRTLFRKSIMQTEFSKLLNKKNVIGYVDIDNPVQSFLRIESLWLSVKLILSGFFTFLPILLSFIFWAVAFDTWMKSKNLKSLLIWLTILLMFFPTVFWWLDFVFDPKISLSMYSQSIWQFVTLYLTI